MKSWYSAKGARRGLWLSILIALLWLSWAMAYSQGFMHRTSYQEPSIRSSAEQHEAVACACSQEA